MCEEHSKLFHAYQEAVALFSTTLNARQATLLTAPRDEYPRMTEYVETGALGVGRRKGRTRQTHYRTRMPPSFWGRDQLRNVLRNFGRAGIILNGSGGEV